MSGSLRPSEHQYVPFIDGLRAIAVLAVVAYHAGVPGPSGGFIGVDIFFVISGYLIINQIVTGLHRGTFSIKTFWARRALRILPSYMIVVVASCLLGAYVLVLPDEIRDFGWQVVFSSLMVVNHYFLEQQGYFDSAADLKPLLHLWSLAVEEQFYVVAPVILAGLAMLARRTSQTTSRILIAIMFAASLVGCIWLTDAYDDKNYAFFLMPLRAWEFMIGGGLVLAVPHSKRLPAIALETLAAMALAGLLFAIVAISADNPWPSYYAIPPVIASATLIAAGLANQNLTIVRALSWAPLIGIGLVSYAWYLWHWPLMVYARIYNFGELPLSWGVGCALASLALATLTYRFIEAPIKSWRKRTAADVRPIPIWSGAGSILVGASIGLLLAGPLLPVLSYQSSEVGKFERGGACSLQAHNSVSNCMAEDLHRTYGLHFGDSYALRTYGAFADLLAKADPASRLTSLISTSCLPLFDADTFVRGATRDKCLDEFSKGKDAIGSDKVPVSYAILQGRWTAAIGHYDGREKSLRPLGPAGSDEPSPDQAIFLKSQLLSTIDTLSRVGVKRIIIVLPTPEFPTPAEACIVRSQKYAADIDERCSIRIQAAEQVRAKTVAIIKEVATARQQVRLIDPFEVFCAKDYCRPYAPETGTALFSDKVHLTRAGAIILTRHYADEIQSLLDRDGSSL